ncbi:hypothetical protein BVY03_05860 [bacterium K02(2017)]|nr:hypothetical protein BVY03_05860 [bacterium K02(2017)]
MKIALYARISTSDGRQDVENQLIELRAWSKRLGATHTVEYVDNVSGSRSDRKALNQLLADAHKNNFETIIIWALDRLSREGIAKTCSYLEQFKRCGIRLLSHQESWLDTNSPTNDLLLAIFSWIAAQERNRIRERIMAGLARAKAQGRVGGRPGVYFDVIKATELRQQGRSIRSIAQALGVPRSTVSRKLSQSQKHPSNINE